MKFDDEQQTQQQQQKMGKPLPCDLHAKKAYRIPLSVCVCARAITGEFSMPPHKKRKTKTVEAQERENLYENDIKIIKKYINKRLFT